MRISRHFRLGVEQEELDFVDINTARDTRLFLDPYLLAVNQDPWSEDASGTVRNFFSFFLGLLYNGQTSEARELFENLHEPNETCLGLSRGRPSGRGVGDDDAERIFDSLVTSQAAQTGLLQDLEDCRVFVRGIDKDKVSDMTTNIIRRHLIEYTVAQCNLWKIPLIPNSPSGFYWNSQSRAWETGFSDNLVVAGRRILLVPKTVVSHCKKYSPEKFHRFFLLRFLQHEHLRLGTNLVQTRVRRDGTKTRFVTKKSLIEDGGAALEKDYLATFTQAHPEVFRDFRRSEATRESSVPLQDLVSRDIETICQYLEDKLNSIEPGNNGATRYHRVVTSILDFLFYPRLSKPTVELEIDEGRKRIDIAFDNGAVGGFFAALANQAQIPCRFIFAECKNYGRDVANPEVDQLAGRFSVNRGRFGLLVCRSVENRERLLARCRDTLVAGRGLILPLVDEDLINALRRRARGTNDPLEETLTELHRHLAM